MLKNDNILFNIKKGIRNKLFLRNVSTIFELMKINETLVGKLSIKQIRQTVTKSNLFFEKQKNSDAINIVVFIIPHFEI